MSTAVAFSNDGKLLAASAVGLDQKQTTYLNIQTLVWTVDAGEKLFTIEGHKVDVPALIFTKDDRFLLTGSGYHDQVLGHENGTVIEDIHDPAKSTGSNSRFALTPS